MALDRSETRLNARIESLRQLWVGYNNELRTRNRAYLRVFSPQFDTRIGGGEHDQWADPIEQATIEYTRSSFNMSRAVVEIWSALEASDFPNLRWQEAFVPTPAPSLDELEQVQREGVFRALKLVARQRATMREQVLMQHVRLAKLDRAFYRAVRRKNVYGHSWTKSWPDIDRRRFHVVTKIDPSIVYPVWTSYESRVPGEILAVYRESARTLNARYPNANLPMADGIHIDLTSYYQPTPNQTSQADLAYAWVEDYWVHDPTYRSDQDPNVQEGTEPVRGMVLNVIRVNGRIVQTSTYPGWTRVPYFLLDNDNERDSTGFSDVATMLPVNDGLNRFLSQQQDVIDGETNPKFKYRGDNDRTIELRKGEVVSLDPDEDIEQIAVHLDVFPTQVHGQQLLDVMERITGLPSTVWGRITSAQNSGRALATAWRAVASRLVPRVQDDAAYLESLLGFWLDCMELYDWDSARDLYGARKDSEGVLVIGNRQFTVDFPNQEPRDFTEVTADALNRMGGGILDRAGAIEATGETSPDEMIERIRGDFMDVIMYPEKEQARLLLQRLRQQIAIEAQQAGLQMAAAQQQLAAQQAAPPGGAPGPGSVDQQAAAANQAQTQAAGQRAPTKTEAQNQPGPATQPGAAANPANPAASKVSTMVQDGKTFNRLVNQGVV